MMARGLIHALRSRIALKLTLTLVGFVAVSLIAAGLYLSRALERVAIEVLESRLTVAGRVLHDEALAAAQPGAPPRALQGFVERATRATGMRVSLIAPDGRVLADSERPGEAVATMDSHADRPEVRAALEGHVGSSVRRSVTLDAPLIYVALPLNQSGRVLGVLRLAEPISAVTASYETLRSAALAGGAVALLVALGIGIFVAGRVTRPVVEMQDVARQMSEGRFDVRAPARSPDEVGTLGRSLNVMAGRLREKIGDLEREQAKATAVLDAMVEGVIATDGRGVVSREVRLGGPAERVLQVHAVGLKFPGDERGVVMILHDITELRRLEQVRTEFVANVSHELRTPLTAIQGYLETLLDGALEEREHARKFLEIVFRHTERLGRLTDDLTDLSNIELGKVTLRLEPTSIAEIAESVVAIISPRASGGQVKVEARLPADLPEVLADRDRLSQILINLVDNAVKYTPKGGQVTVEGRVDASGMIEVAVRDTGVGIPKADLPRLTERFYRVDKARSRDLGGTGLGLAIVKHLVLAHGGELDIESELWKGTTVRFTLPRGVRTASAI